MKFLIDYFDTCNVFFVRGKCAYFNVFYSGYHRTEHWYVGRVSRLRVLRRVPAVVRGVLRLRTHLRLPHRSRRRSQPPGLVRKQRPPHDGHRQSNGPYSRLPIRLIADVMVISRLSLTPHTLSFLCLDFLRGLLPAARILCANRFLGRTACVA